MLTSGLPAPPLAPVSPAEAGPAQASKVVVVGLGYVGLPLALRATEVGHLAVGFDTDSARLAMLRAGQSYIEDVPSERLRAALATGRFVPTWQPADCAGFDVAVLAVPTPLREGLPDLTYLQGAAEIVGQHIRPGATVVVESTSYPRTTQDQVQPRLEAASGLVAGRDFRLGYSPERIDPRNAFWTLEKIPKIVSGIAQGRQGLLRHARQRDGRGVRAARGRAGQAHREHVQARQPRPG